MLSVVKGIEPRDQIEAMLAAQMAAVHVATMTFARRLAHVENIPQQDSAERAFNKLTRTFTTQMEALKRYRTGGEQKVTVQHVSVAKAARRSSATSHRRNARMRRKSCGFTAAALSDSQRSFPCQSLTKARNALPLQGGANQTNERRSQTQYRADAFQPSLRRQDPLGQALQVTISQGKKRCRMHGGAPGSGAPRGNKNALKHGLYTREAIEERRQLRELMRQSRQLLLTFDVSSRGFHTPAKIQEPLPRRKTRSLQDWAEIASRRNADSYISGFSEQFKLVIGSLNRFSASVRAFILSQG